MALSTFILRVFDFLCRLFQKFLSPLWLLFFFSGKQQPPFPPKPRVSPFEAFEPFFSLNRSLSCCVESRAISPSHVTGMARRSIRLLARIPTYFPSEDGKWTPPPPPPRRETTPLSFPAASADREYYVHPKNLKISLNIKTAFLLFDVASSQAASSFPAK